MDRTTEDWQRLEALKQFTPDPSDVDFVPGGQLPEFHTDWGKNLLTVTYLGGRVLRVPISEVRLDLILETIAEPPTAYARRFNLALLTAVTHPMRDKPKLDDSLLVEWRGEWALMQVFLGLPGDLMYFPRFVRIVNNCMVELTDKKPPEWDQLGNSLANTAATSSVPVGTESP